VTTYFLDSSAIAKRYLTETGSEFVADLVDHSALNTIVLAEITRVEVAAALAARQRTGSGLTMKERDQAVALMLRHCDREYRMVPLTPDVLGRAVGLTQNHRLRGFDAVQLGAALITNDSLRAAGLEGLVFVTADNDLIHAAMAEKLPSENPNNYSLQRDIDR
jgi:predicted nucleic acid-binding protein